MSKNPLFIKNAKIVTGDGSAPFNGSVLISYADGKGKFSEIGKIDPPRDANVFDAEGCYLMPAFTDIGCRYFDPNFPQRESIRSADAAALGGGFLNLLCEPHENGETLSEKIISESRCRITPSFSLKSPSEIASGGKRIYSDNGFWISDSALAREFMLSCAKSDSLYISSCFDKSLAGDGILSPGKTAKVLGLKTIPESAETTAVARDVFLAAETGCRLHVRAVSTKNSVEIIRFAKKQGISVTCSTSPLYFSMSDNDIFYYGSSAKVLPPLRSNKDVDAIRDALLDGTIDCVSSLHTPLSKLENCPDLSKSRFGASGFDNAMSAFVTFMINRGFGSYGLLASLMSVNPSKILGFDSTIKVNGNADFVLVNADSEIVVSLNSMKSKSNNTPFFGFTLCGTVKSVFADGFRA